MIRRTIILVFINFFIIQTFSCNLSKKGDLDYLILENQWSGETVFYSDVSSNILKQKNINRGWSRLKGNKTISYFRLQQSKGTVLGNYFKDQKEYLVIQLENGRKYKWEKNYWEIDDKAFPSHLSRLKIQNEAKKMIGQFIWLNIIDSDTAYINNTILKYNKFDKAIVNGIKVFQNGGRDWPIWLELNVDNDFNTFVRYNGQKKIKGKQNYYFVDNPIPKSWGSDMIRKIINGQLEYGMKEEQVRASIGNPNTINNTSSRHNVSEQWIYGNILGKKKYLLFEYGTLVSM
ncbi:MAG: hypothetical protein CBD77_04580 [bacterium TMED217]|nr:MAG: hypothetical protein CBD77_04580 [bacterium TMED217]